MTNYFDLNKEFFIIDTKNIKEIKTRLYGYCVQENGIIENENLTIDNQNGINGLGAYVYIKRNKSTIEIIQDSLGSYGLYLFEWRDGYFAISNSFFYLLQHVKSKYDITLNKDFLYQFLAINFCSAAYSETLANEIELISRDAILEIDIPTKTIKKRRIDWRDKTISLDTAKGVAIVDSWFNRWIKFFQEIKKRTNNISVDLTGGMDSRLVFMLLLKSGINFNDINVRSTNDSIHTHKEDYQIASEISEHYGFKLNNGTNCDETSISFSLEDILNMSIYSKMNLHKEMNWRYKKYISKHYTIPGYAGELIRAYCQWPIQKQINDFLDRAEVYSYPLSQEIKNAVQKIYNHFCEEISLKYNINETKEESEKLTLWLVYELVRNHHAKAAVWNYFTNTYALAPLADPKLLQLKLETSKCSDHNLLQIFLYIRYCPELLNFRIGEGRSFNSKTIMYAKEINNRFPYKNITTQKISPFNITQTNSELSDMESKNQPISKNVPDKLLLNVFSTKSFKDLITLNLNEHIYLKSQQLAKVLTYYPLRQVYPLIAAAFVLRKESGNYVNWLKKIDQENTENTLEILNGYENLFTSRPDIADFFKARIDIRINSSNDARCQLISCSDKNIHITKPGWFIKNGDGYVVISRALSLDLELKSDAEGKLDIYLRGIDKRNYQGNRIPYWVDYKKLTFNKKVLFKGLKPVWHDLPMVFTVAVKSEEIISLHIEWTIHKDNRKILVEEKAINSPIKPRLHHIESPKSKVEKFLYKFKRYYIAIKRRKGGLKNK